MKLAAIASLGLFLSATALLAAQPPQGEAPPIVVEGEAVARIEIERILEADNVDTSRLTSVEVVEALRAIRRGRAPADLWDAYEAHVDAWERFADVEARAAAGADGPATGDALAKLESAELAIDTTFDEVERIAIRYGARLPVPPFEAMPTV
jgi:hypothetical protein